MTTQKFTVRWSGEVAAPPEQVWNAITRDGAGWIWPISYEPWVGGAEKGLNGGGGTVTAWEPFTRFATRANEGFNQLDYRLTPTGAGTRLAYEHRGEAADDHEVDACRLHTAFYYHSLGEYLAHFAGRDATYVTADAPISFDAVRTGLGLPAGVAVGDRVTLTPSGLRPVDGVVDYATPAFLGVRGADALYRFYGRDRWGWPVGLAHHFFGAPEPAWTTWLRTGAVA